MSNIHVLLFVDFYYPHRGGVETMFAQLVERLIKRGHHVTIITSRYENTLPCYEKNHHLTIIRTGSSRLSYMWSAYRAGVRLLSSRDHGITHIHASTYSGVWPAVLLARRYQLPSVVTVHEVFGRLWYRRKSRRGWWYHLFEKSLFRLPADQYHCVSYYTFNSLRLLYGIPDQRMTVIHNGVDQQRLPDPAMECSPYVQSQQYTVLYYGHAGYTKGIDFLIEALPMIMQQLPHIHIVCNIIDSKQSARARRQIARLAQQGQITLLDGLPLDQLKQLVASVDVVVAPSLVEGFGSVVSEVSSLGQTLITTYAGAIPESSWGDIVMIPPSDAIAISDAVVGVYHRVQRSAKPALQTFDWEDTVDQLEQLYQHTSKSRKEETS